jgi:tetratricopeptide (TPR) repeat protein
LGGLSIFRKNEQALEVAKKILEADQQNPDAHTSVGEFYARLGRYREAIAAYQEAIKLGDDSPDAQALLAYSYAGAGEPDKARAILKRYESGNEYCSPVALAIIHLALGDRDKAFASLEAAYAAHDQQLIWLRGEWRFDDLHSDLRFQDLARRVGLLS